MSVTGYDTQSNSLQGLACRAVRAHILASHVQNSEGIIGPDQWEERNSSMRELRTLLEEWGEKFPEPDRSPYCITGHDHFFGWCEMDACVCDCHEDDEARP